MGKAKKGANEVKISNMSDEMVEGLSCRWGYKDTVVKEIEVKDDEDKVVGTTPKNVPNPQSKLEFVTECLAVYATSEYLAQVRADDRVESDKAAEAKVKEEVKLKLG